MVSTRTTGQRQPCASSLGLRNPYLELVDEEKEEAEGNPRGAREEEEPAARGAEGAEDSPKESARSVDSE